MEPHYKKLLGALTDAEAEALYSLANSVPLKRILEIGTFVGKSASVLAQACDTLICIDMFPTSQKYWASAFVVENPLQTFLINMDSFHLLEKVITFKGNTSDILPKLNGKFGMIYIDGGHDMRDVLPNSLMAWQHLVEGGVLAWHDYENKSWPDVKIVVDMLCKKWEREPKIVGTLASITK